MGERFAEAIPRLIHQREEGLLGGNKRRQRLLCFATAAFAFLPALAAQAEQRPGHGAHCDLLPAFADLPGCTDVRQHRGSVEVGVRHADADDLDSPAEIDDDSGLAVGDMPGLVAALETSPPGTEIRLPAGAIFYVEKPLFVRDGRRIVGANRYDREDGVPVGREGPDGKATYALPDTETVLDASRFCPEPRTYAPGQQIAAPPIVTGIDGGIARVTLRYGEVRQHRDWTQDQDGGWVQEAPRAGNTRSGCGIEFHGTVFGLADFTREGAPVCHVPAGAGVRPGVGIPDLVPYEIAPGVVIYVWVCLGGPGIPDLVFPIALIGVGDTDPAGGEFDVEDCVLSYARRGVMALASGGAARSVRAVVEGSVFSETGGNGAEAFMVDGASIAATFRNNLFTGIGPRLVDNAPAFVGTPVPDDTGSVFFVSPVDSNASLMEVVSENNRFEHGLGIGIDAGTRVNLYTAGGTSNNLTRFWSVDDQFVDNALWGYAQNGWFTAAALVVSGGNWGADGGTVLVSLIRPTFARNTWTGPDGSTIRSDLAVMGGFDNTLTGQAGISAGNTAGVVIRRAHVADGAEGTFRVLDGLSQGTNEAWVRGARVVRVTETF